MNTLKAQAEETIYYEMILENWITENIDVTKRIIISLVASIFLTKHEIYMPLLTISFSLV